MNIKALGSWAALLLCLSVLTGCGGGDGGDEGPSEVSEADLQESGEFWASLDSDLQRELAGICQTQQVQQASTPAEALAIQDYDQDDYVAQISDLYEEQSGNYDIETTCEAAKTRLAAEALDQLTPQLDSANP